MFGAPGGDVSLGSVLVAARAAFRSFFGPLLAVFFVGALCGGVTVWRYDRKPDPRVALFVDSLKVYRAEVGRLRAKVHANQERVAPVQHQATASLNAVAARLVQIDLGVKPMRPGELRDLAAVVSTAAARIDTVYRTDSTAIVSLQAALDRANLRLSQAAAIINTPRPSSPCGVGGAVIYGLKGFDAGAGFVCKIPIRLPFIG